MRERDIDKVALITGITGQDGSYLAELLLAKGYEVHGMIRRASTFNTSRIDAIRSRLHLHYGDMTDAMSVRYVIDASTPDEIYNLAAQSHVQVSFQQPGYTMEVVAMGTLRVLEVAARCLARRIRVYQASSSEMFGASAAPQDEGTAFHPCSPYGIAKLAAYWHAHSFREGYGMFVANGILFNHESPRRGETFVTRKITRAVGRIKLGLQDKVHLGNLDARRDWGYAPDYVEVMWRMLQQDQPDDYVVATGESHTVREFVEQAFDYAGLDWAQHVEIDENYERTIEVDALEGDSSKARRVLGWRPTVSFDELVRMMVDHDLELAQQEKRANG